MNLEPLIFVVDDDKFMHQLLNAILFSLSLKNVENYYSGEECLNHINKQPDYILLDFEMNGLDGIETLKHIKKSLPNAKVIMISGQNRLQIASNALKTGAESYFQKDRSLASNLKKYFSNDERPATA
ncbi:MAG: response regulator transcription factor [Bacteroidota bacterium]